MDSLSLLGVEWFLAGVSLSPSLVQDSCLMDFAMDSLRRLSAKGEVKATSRTPGGRREGSWSHWRV